MPSYKASRVASCQCITSTPPHYVKEELVDAPPLVHQHRGELVVNEVQGSLAHALRHAPNKPLPVPGSVPFVFIYTTKEAPALSAPLPLPFPIMSLGSGQLHATAPRSEEATAQVFPTRLTAPMACLHLQIFLANSSLMPLYCSQRM